MLRDVLDQVLASYPADLCHGDIEPLGNAGGFSGACFWRIHCGGTLYCLRRWPREHPSRNRLSFIHGILQQVADRGVDFVPIPLTTSSKATFVDVEGYLWEVAPWLPGEANYAGQPSRTKLCSALAALAQFHVAAVDHGQPQPSKSRGIRERRDRLIELSAGGADRIRRALTFSGNAKFTILGQQILERFFQHAPSVLATVEQAGEHAVHQQPCIRDVWHDHILFLGDRVTGIVDFGAMRTESVAGDIARLLGSLAKDDRAQWEEGIRAYEAIRPLDELERGLIRAFDESTVLLSGMNWLEWIFVERRQFDNEPHILARLAGTLDRLGHVTHSDSQKVLWNQ